ncbi:MAG TPA: hypothetical protein PKN33_16350 [Phycisphaerae bacterium]|nr:hypothetical protein [Phycisphaerae bacterium]
MGKQQKPKGPGHWIFVAFITLRNGKRIFASSYGLKAFKIWVKD